jgi:hypothetical protein
MKLSGIIKDIEKEIEVYGDAEVLSYKFTHLHATSESWKWSPNRRARNGQRARMNQKEFKEWCEKRVEVKEVV